MYYENEWDIYGENTENNQPPLSGKQTCAITCTAENWLEIYFVHQEFKLRWIGFTEGVVIPNINVIPKDVVPASTSEECPPEDAIDDDDYDSVCNWLALLIKRC